MTQLLNTDRDIAAATPLPASPTISECSSVDGELVCSGCDAAQIELQEMREAWRTQRKQYLQDRFEVIRLSRLLEACDAAFDGMRAYDTGYLPAGSTLSEIAAEIIQKNDKCRSVDDHAKVKSLVHKRSKEMHKKAQELLQSNRLFTEAARLYYNELETLADWLSKGALHLEKKYDRYCVIMREGGMIPQLMYDRKEELLACEQAFQDAYENRQQTMVKIVEKAQTHGMADLFSEMFCD